MIQNGAWRPKPCPRQKLLIPHFSLLTSHSAEQGVIAMDDRALLDRYFARDESALKETAEKYGTLCRSLAQRLLGDPQDAEETFNDALLRAWQHIPPDRPASLPAYLCALTRRIATDRLRSAGARKRGGSALRLNLEELAECIPAPESVEQEADRRALADAISAFLAQQSKESRVFFMQRYWAMHSVAEIARQYGISENTVKSILKRTRDRLRSYLEQEGLL